MPKPLKFMVDREVVEDIASRVVAATPAFDAAGFIADLMVALPELELKPRITAIAERLHAGLERPYQKALEVVVAVARQEPLIEGFAAWPLCTFVETFGLDDPSASLAAMEHLTKRASCEFAIRPFLQAHWEEAYAKLLEFTSHPDEAVRRLASEGSRPRLPWGMGVGRLVTDPEPGLALVERLRHDPSETVRRSVANHLNDVAKVQPDLVVTTVVRWSAEPATDSKMVSHALRTLVKAGHPGALEALGLSSRPEIEVIEFNVTPATVVMGDHIELSTTIRSTSAKPQRLVMDFIIHHINKSGETSPKVFKWTTLELEPKATATMRKRRLIQTASTRTYHGGEHRVELQVAGKIAAEASFHISV